jgi:protein deglycase
MASVAVLMAEGFEEGETTTIIDILRRAGVTCDSFAIGTNPVLGMHGIRVVADKTFGSEISDYDMIVLPGGRPGGENLRTNSEVIALVREFTSQGRWVAAMCSGTTVLAEAKVIEGKKVTGYTGYADKMPGATFLEDVVVVDPNLVTSQGPATPYPFAYAIAEALGVDTAALRERMLYHRAGGK